MALTMMIADSVLETVGIYDFGLTTKSSNPVLGSNSRLYVTSSSSTITTSVVAYTIDPVFKWSQ